MKINLSNVFFIMPSFEEFLHLYKEEFLPAYSDLVGFIADKPSNMLLDIENTFSHFMVHFIDGNPKTSQDNLDKAYNHLIRLTLDCHKLLWATINNVIDDLMGDETKRKFIVTLPEDELIRRYKKYKLSAQDARKTEILNIGINPLAAIQKYKIATELALSIIENIDEIKARYYEKHRFRYWIQTQLVGILVGGIIATLLVTFILKLLHWA